jgi:hypothetical protein
VNGPPVNVSIPAFVEKLHRARPGKESVLGACRCNGAVLQLRETLASHTHASPTKSVWSLKAP